MLPLSMLHYPCLRRMMHTLSLVLCLTN
uniref:Uncharacterized protein n=1 Tax=Arundo donax TaxID=35708 RepID=A0A0A8YHL9_ARUDO